jgi:hypothetical protein
MDPASDDYCPFCREALKIVCVRFNFFSTRMVLACPNCANASAEHSPDLFQGNNAWPTRQLGFSLRRTLAFAIGALAVAAALRHVIHIYGGFSPAEIRIGAAALFFLICSVLFFLKNS